MTELLTAAQMSAIERAAIDAGEVTGMELMERAGQGVVDAIFEEWPELDRRGASPSHSFEYSKKDEEQPLRAVVLCGPGNNGGDGFVVARLLRELGWEVWVFLYGDPEKLPPDARVNYERWSKQGDVHDFLSDLPEELFFFSAEGLGVVVDALFGTGLSRPLSIDVQRRLGDFRSIVPICFLHSVSVDVPSGFDSDSGRFLVEGQWKPFVTHNDLCVTFHRPRVGHYLEDAAFGTLATKNIGLDELARARNFQNLKEGLAQLSDLVSGTESPEEIKTALLEGGDPTSLIKFLPDEPVELIEWVQDEVEKFPTAHKYTHGHALILSGGSGQTGAARLAARGALRIGAGLVTLGVPPAAQMEVACQITALMMRRVEGAEGLAEALQDQRLNALCLGPGLGLERARALVPVALAAQRATVLDADALTAFGEDPDKLFELLHPNCVLTPHGGEFARLFPDIAEKLTSAPTVGPAYSKVDATREAARRAGCVVLFKGPDTVIAGPDGRCAINAAMYERAAPWLATAGSGDVLAGFITGLLARGIAPQSAAETAAWLHVECARQFGPGLIAEDLPEQLPAVLRNLLSDQKN
ncbi:NAD(P)H-hydrate dehydratase [Ruegeria sp. HKCCD7255]|uniref:NAD(P)H-hydrate dehydratase n=1 Tax=Ruegeria sp. HKCCD7255 TaxID=2683004 RepID=UPI001488FB93|nr:NAD(P)H-hydrate dehydratase [Ruegeria sp. HKCCD7255]